MTTRWKEEKAESPQTLKSNAFSFQSPKQNKMSPLPVPEDVALQIASFLQGWRCFYMELHNEKAARATSVVQFVETCSSSVSLEVGEYQKAMQDLHALQFGYQDVQMFLFKPELTVLVNLLGLHYCINWLGVPANCVLKALESRKISERQVCVKWWKLGIWSHGFRMRDELLSRRFTLIDVGLAKQEEVLAVLYRGAIHEVLRVQICVADPSSPSWSCQSAHRRG
ncbi:hypothetical protein PRUPE_1G365500 [Prunus persica]|uniref:Uncharacterized protein n=1 Tax=Prunus persica TaxID=3760 RepID=A0A251R8P1_PRUPE|nr:hypothetical protein PRUPE_1G365500 [Prunus persica]